MSNHLCMNAECSSPTSNPKYCSVSCATAVNNQNKRIKGTSTVRRCTYCDSVTPNVTIHYCNDGCRKAMANLRIARREYTRIRPTPDTDLQIYRIWSEGDTKGLVRSDSELSAAGRNLLLRVRGFSCSMCGWDKKNPVTGRVPVTIDHIDGDAHNNALANLRVLCPNCHSLTSTYGSLNSNSSRVKNGLPRLDRKYARLSR